MMSYAEKPEDITKEEWMEKLNNVHIQRADMNRLIMNYLVTGEFNHMWDDQPREWAEFKSLPLFYMSEEGFKEAAEKFRMESGIEPSVDLDSLDERIKIREMILKGQIQEAIALINSLHPELLDTNRYLYFHLQVWLHKALLSNVPFHGFYITKSYAGLCKTWQDVAWTVAFLFPFLFLAAAFDWVNQAKGDWVSAGVRSDPTGRAGGGEPRVSDRDGANVSPAGLRQPRGVALRRSAEHDAEAKGGLVLVIIRCLAWTVIALHHLVTVTFRVINSKCSYLEFDQIINSCYRSKTSWGYLGIWRPQQQRSLNYCIYNFSSNAFS